MVNFLDETVDSFACYFQSTVQGIQNPYGVEQNHSQRNISTLCIIAEFEEYGRHLGWMLMLLNSKIVNPVTYITPPSLVSVHFT